MVNSQSGANPENQGNTKETSNQEVSEITSSSDNGKNDSSEQSREVVAKAIEDKNRGIRVDAKNQESREVVSQAIPLVSRSTELSGVVPIFGTGETLIQQTSQVTLPKTGETDSMVPVRLGRAFLMISGVYLFRTKKR